MALSEILTLLAVIISLLGLIFTVIFGTFDIAWKIAERQNKNGTKEMTALYASPSQAVISFDHMVRS